MGTLNHKTRNEFQLLKKHIPINGYAARKQAVFLTKSETEPTSDVIYQASKAGGPSKRALYPSIAEASAQSGLGPKIWVKSSAAPWIINIGIRMYASKWFLDVAKTMLGGRCCKERGKAYSNIRYGHGVNTALFTAISPVFKSISSALKSQQNMFAVVTIDGINIFFSKGIGCDFVSEPSKL
ncbi:MAG TPA: hypothetical protein VFB60_26075 [Ktedonobacteraceae bacterium]|nr:hypothetical protein [Ktedonobacteraceae bacterium]